MLQFLLGNKKALLGILVVLIIIFGGGYLFFSQKGQKEESLTEPSASPTPQATESLSPTLTATPEATPKSTPKSTSTPTPTPTPTPTLTPIPTPTTAPVIFPKLIPLKVVFKVTGVSVSVFPIDYTGPCPKEFDFSASITVNTAGAVTYKWIRSDGVQGPTKSLTFSGADTKNVLDTWILYGGPGFSYSGWEKVQILTPNTLDSNQANFSHNCET